MNAPSFAARALALGALAAGTVPTAASAAVAGDPDPGFGSGGLKQLTSTGAPVDALIQPDGKTIIVSDGQYSAKAGFIVTRLNLDGSLDRSFSHDGAAIADFGDNDIPTGAALQADGKIVVAGGAGQNGTMAVARFDTDGELDTTFDPGGGDGDGKKLVTGESAAADVIVQADGEIVLANSRPGLAADQDLAAVRLSENGVKDPTVFQPADFGGDNAAVAAASVPDAGIIVIGRVTEAGVPATAVARYKLDGKLDAAFGGTGKVKIPAIGGPKSVLVTPAGKVVVTGTTGGDEPNTVVVRLNTDGGPDDTFGTAGVADVDFEGQDTAVTTALAPGGKLLVAGQQYFGVAFAAARLTADGKPDPSYGSGGFTQMPVADLVAAGSAGAALADGRFVIAGLTIIAGPAPRTAVIRLAATGTPGPEPVPTATPGTPQPQSTPQPTTPQPLTDTVAPRLGGLRVTAPFVRFTLSEAAQVQFTLKPARSGGRARQTFSAAGIAGANRVRVARRMKPGRYRLTAVAVDAAGNIGPTQRVSLTVKKARS